MAETQGQAVQPTSGLNVAYAFSNKPGVGLAKNMGVLTWDGKRVTL